MASTNTILIIDDEPNLRRSLTLILQRAGYTVTMAGNALEANQYLEAGAFDLVFLDLKMPDTNGLELLRYLF
jgi:CheY-like chemotaxis protein